MYKILPAIFAFALFACGDKTTDKTEQPTGEKENTPYPDSNKANNINGCYLRVIQRDTLIASLTQDGNIVTGKLIFDNYEKDGSAGMVTGKIEGDIIKLVYRFRSEGMNSISEQFFKITKDGLLQGIGDVAAKGDSAYFSDPAKIRYNEKDKLTRISCDKLKL